MSWTGGTTAPFSSSSSESSLGLLTAFVSTALLSTGPLPSTASSGAPPVMILTASSTAIEAKQKDYWRVFTSMPLCHSLCYTAETNTTLLSTYSPISKKKYAVKENICTTLDTLSFCSVLLANSEIVLLILNKDKKLWLKLIQFS